MRASIFYRGLGVEDRRRGPRFDRGRLRGFGFRVCLGFRVFRVFRVCFGFRVFRIRLGFRVWGLFRV